MTEPDPYERLGGVFAIAAVVDHLSDAIVRDPVVGRESAEPCLGGLKPERQMTTDRCPAP